LPLREHNERSKGSINRPIRGVVGAITPPESLSATRSIAKRRLVSSNRSVSPFKSASAALYLCCTICYSTGMIPFRVHFQSGLSLCEQVVYAAKKAVISGQLRPGDPFPSVRTLSRELKINPNTAHKVIGNLISAGLVETRPGLGTVVSALPKPSSAERMRLLGSEVEQLVVEARRLGIELNDMVSSISTHWERLTDATGPGHSSGRRGQTER
jgi:GntR family transcriptional regulator